MTGRSEDGQLDQTDQTDTDEPARPSKLMLVLFSAALALITVASQPPYARASDQGIHASIPHASIPATCSPARRQPTAVIRIWIRTYARGTDAPCRLTTSSYRPHEPAFGPYQSALVLPLRSQSQPGHQLYLVLLITQTRAARYLLDLKPAPGGHWLIDLWAEL